MLKRRFDLPADRQLRTTRAFQPSRNLLMFSGYQALEKWASFDRTIPVTAKRYLVYHN